MRCLYCGKEIEEGDFCEEHDTENRRALLTLFRKVSPFRLRGWEYDFFETFFKLEDYDTIVVKAPRGAYKSTVADLVAVISCELYTDIEILIASVSFPVALQHIRNIKNMIRNSQDFSDYSHSELFVEDTKQHFELASGVRVFAVPQSEKTQTGYHPDLKIVDELARMRPDFYYSTIFPMGRSKETELNVREIIISTGFGSSGAFGDILKGNDPSVYKMDVSIDQCWWLKDRLEIERARMPEHLFRQEMLGEIVDDVQKVFPTEHIYSSLIEKASSSGNHVMAIDLGRKVDFTAVVVIDVRNNHVLYAERLKDPIFKQSWEAQFDYIRSLAERWKPKDIYIDATGLGDVVAQELDDLNPIEVIITSSVKQDLISNLQLLFESESIKIPSEFTDLIEELDAFEYQGSKFEKMGAPIGYHDDLVMALAMACQDLQSSLLRSSTDPYSCSFGKALY